MLDITINIISSLPNIVNLEMINKLQVAYHQNNRKPWASGQDETEQAYEKHGFSKVHCDNRSICHTRLNWLVVSWAAMTKDHKLSNLKTNIFSHSSGASSERKVMSVGLVFYRGLALWLFPFQLAILFFFPCLNLSSLCSWLGLPWWHSGNESACQCRIGTIPWSRKWLPTPGCMSGMLPGQRSLAGYSSWGHKESDMTAWLSTPTLFMSVSWSSCLLFLF